MKRNFLFTNLFRLCVCLFIFSGIIYNFETAQAAELVFDDFNDRRLGSNLGGQAGPMSYNGAHDPQLSFVTSTSPAPPPEPPGPPEPPEPPLPPFPAFSLSVRTQAVQTQSAYEGYALKITYNFPSGKWCGYWSFTNDGEASSYDVSRYTDIRLWARGQNGGEKFKIELVDASNHIKAVDITVLPGFSAGLTSGYQEAVFPLSAFTGVDMRRLKQVNIVFDRAPTSGAIYVDYIRFTRGSIPQPGLPIYDDFNDGIWGPNLGGEAGPMSYNGARDPTVSFNGPNASEGIYGLEINYNAPSGQWVGYWSKWTTARNVSAYTDIRLDVKGVWGQEKFKVELFDSSDNKRGVYITLCPGFENGATIAYQEAVIPLSTFTGVDLTRLKGVNIVFDRVPWSGTVYLDKIYFTNISPSPTPLDGLILDNFNDGSGPNELSGDCGTMDPETGNPVQWISEDYVNDLPFAHEGLGVLKLQYDRGPDSWVGYWSYMRPDRGGYNVTSYTDIRINARGNIGREKFKVELTDTAGNAHSANIIMADGFAGGLVNSEYREAVLPLALFTGVNLSLLKQVNIIFNQNPNRGTVYLDYIRFTDISPMPIPITGLIVDDFNDRTLLNNLGAGTGIMVPLGNPSGNMEIDFETEIANIKESPGALEMNYNIGSSWVGYFSFMRPQDDADIVGRDISSYTDLRMWIKGAGGGERFKVELKDVNGGMHAVNCTVVQGFYNGATNAYQEIIIPLNVFSAVDLRRLKQFSIIFDQPESASGRIYLDLIRFTTMTQGLFIPPGLIVDTFNDGIFTNELGGSSGVMSGGAGATVSAQFDPLNRYEGLAALKLTYNRALSWVGYWTFMRPAGDTYIIGRDVSSYTDLRMWLKGAVGGENLKVELKDRDNFAQFQSVSANNVYEEKILPLSGFPGVDLVNLKQINLIFDQVPDSGTVYVDCIRFTGVKPTPPPAPPTPPPAPPTPPPAPPTPPPTPPTPPPTPPTPPTPVINQPPVVRVSAYPRRGRAPLTVDFFLRHSYDPDGSIVNYAWDFGDGNTSALANPSHTYTIPAGIRRRVYYARLTVTDDRGATVRSRRIRITVNRRR